MKALAIVPLLLAAAPALAEDTGLQHYVRNDTRRTVDCSIQRFANRKLHRFVLPQGRDHNWAVPGGQRWTLTCDVRWPRPRFSIRAGSRYALVEREPGWVVLHRID